MSVVSVLFSGTMLAQTIRMAVPYACASMGGVVSERSGVVNIALEGLLLSSAFVSIAVSIATGSPWLGVVSGIATGAVVGALHGGLVVAGRVDAIVSGLAINLAALGATRFGLRALYGSSSNSPRAPSLWGTDGDASPLLGFVDPFAVLTLLSCAALMGLLARTRFGLRLRAVGEDPVASRAVGIPVVWTRIVAVSLGGAFAGLGGTALAFELHQFQAGMTGGRGYIALAAVVVSGWRVGMAFVACLVFAALDAGQIALQNHLEVPPQVASMIPFVATLVVLLVLRKSRLGAAPPAGLGKHAD